MQEATRGGPWVIPEFLGVCRVLTRQADNLFRFLMAFLARVPKAGISRACHATFRQHRAYGLIGLRNGRSEKKPPIRRLAV